MTTKKKSANIHQTLELMAELQDSKRRPPEAAPPPKLQPGRYSPREYEYELDLDLEEMYELAQASPGRLDAVEELRARVDQHLDGRSALSLMPAFGSATDRELFESEFMPLRHALVERYGRTVEVVMLADLAAGAMWEAQSRSMIASRMLNEGRITEASKVDSMAQRSRREVRLALEALVRTRRPAVHVHVAGTGPQVIGIGCGDEGKRK